MLVTSVIGCLHKQPITRDGETKWFPLSAFALNRFPHLQSKRQNVEDWHGRRVPNQPPFYRKQTVLFAWNVRLALQGANAQRNSEQRNKAERLQIPSNKLESTPTVRR